MMNKEIKILLDSWKDELEVEATVFHDDVMVAHFEFGIFGRRSKKKTWWTISTLSGDACFFVRETMDARIFFDPSRRPHIVISV